MVFCSYRLRYEFDIICHFRTKAFTVVLIQIERDEKMKGNVRIQIRRLRDASDPSQLPNENIRNYYYYF
ncbi:hypothetical protein QE152_g32340 [Popillia japonica]|uniref:Uncharacterized protein n=1 Tax=Popillia japonica TaxID=7064 RepID=A0AAW1IZD0_POPJA